MPVFHLLKKLRARISTARLRRNLAELLAEALNVPALLRPRVWRQQQQRTLSGRVLHSSLRFEPFEERAVLAAVVWNFDQGHWKDTSLAYEFTRSVDQGSDGLTGSHNLYDPTFTPQSGSAFAYLQVGNPGTSTDL